MGVQPKWTWGLRVGEQVAGGSPADQAKEIPLREEVVHSMFSKAFTRGPWPKRKSQESLGMVAPGTGSSKEAITKQHQEHTA